MPMTPTKTANHSVLMDGDLGANISNKSEAMGQIDADTAHNIPRPRNDSVNTPGIRSARSLLKKTGNNPQWLASSTKKNECVTAMNTETQNETGRCMSNRGSSGF